MDIIEGILTRRSIRRFTGEVISEENIEVLLRAGFAAPSAHNYRPWHFIVIKDKLTLEKITTFHPYSKMLPQAGCGIVVCGDGNAQKLEGFMIADCAAAIQNMLLAANGLGLGSVWCGLHPVTELTEPMKVLLNLPDNITPIGLVVVGNTDEKKGSWNRYDEGKIHKDKW